MGNFDHVIEHAYKQCYFPFVKLLTEFPGIKVSLHNTGILWDWIEHNQPEYFKYIEKLLSNGQLELLSGGFYEPILPVIFESHRKGQIDKLTEYLLNKFGVKARGMWLAERVWEPQLAKTLSDCGMEYTILDDTHFRWAGLTEDQLDGYFITEEQHRKLALFPISKPLRYAIPFKTVKKVMEIFREAEQKSPGKLVVYADDGEKFGVWPDTYKLCYDEKWLSKFFQLVSENSDWLKMVFFSEALDSLPSNGRTYLPTASYAEMGQWSLPPDGFNHYEEVEKHLKDTNLWEDKGYLVRGGFWRNFLSKYPEANNMHKKMYHVAAKIENLNDVSKTKKKKLAKAVDLLYQGQCNCPYWHGVFGGLYLNHLRYATYNRLIQAEVIADELGALPEGGKLELIDFDDDGQNEIIAETSELNAYFSPRYGGSMFELDLKKKGYNLLDTMTRRREGYHKKLSELSDSSSGEGQSIHDRIEVKEKGLEKYLIYDWYRRASFIDHVMPSQMTFDRFAGNDYNEPGDFIIEPFEYKTKKTASKLGIELSRKGYIYYPDRKFSLTVKKNIDILLKQPSIEAAYTLENRSDAAVDFLFGVEFNWAMLAGDSPDRYYYVDNHNLDDARMVSQGEIPDVSGFGLKDEYHKLDISFKLSEPCRFWRMPIETVSLSESGFERVYQSSMTCLCFNIRLAPDETRHFKIVIRFREI